MFRTFITRSTQKNSTQLFKKNKINKEINNIKKNKNTKKSSKENIVELTDKKLKEANKNIFLL